MACRRTLEQPQLDILTMQLRIALQRHFSVLTKFAHVELRVCGRKGRGKTSFDVPVNPCVRSICSRSVAVGIVLFTALLPHILA
jgi:hypothetical protein